MLSASGTAPSAVVAAVNSNSHAVARIEHELVLNRIALGRQRVYRHAGAPR
jgi:hypothetical protein